jgi:hypothetical protein
MPVNYSQNRIIVCQKMGTRNLALYNIETQSVTEIELANLPGKFDNCSSSIVVTDD